MRVKQDSGDQRILRLMLACTRGFVLLQGCLMPCLAASATPFPPDWPHRAPWQLSQEILEAEEVLFLVERLRGSPPRAEALDHLVKVASSHCRGSARWLRADDPAAPAFQWTDGSPPTEDSVGRELPLDHTELRAWTTQVARFSEGPAGSRAVIFVRYVGECSRYGFVLRNSVGDGLPVIYLCQNEIAKRMPPGFSRPYFEQRALVHEFGHAIRLGTNPSHGVWKEVTPYRGGPHCSNPDCAVAVPTAKALLRGQMLDFCQECRDDLEAARGYWREGLVFAEVRRLPQPDPAELVKRLKARNFSPGGEAEKLKRSGKPIVEPLLRRMETLRGGKFRSPRRVAARIVVQVIIDEDRKRRAATSSDALRYGVPRADFSPALKAWFETEQEAFLNGDEWPLPDFLVPLEAGEPPGGGH